MNIEIHNEAKDKSNKNRMVFCIRFTCSLGKKVFCHTFENDENITIPEWAKKIDIAVSTEHFDEHRF